MKMVYKIKIRITVTTEDGRVITDLTEDKYINDEALEALLDEEPPLE